ncbi:MAG: hypothetical protein AMJ56_20175 [Anaerolineae bacterium SG8_19]|jgi:hypothetical protein|nr:MAG: hypothetical protein AMJ56_20175 [Anaerolineae bacterium SG8_19]
MFQNKKLLFFASLLLVSLSLIILVFGLAQAVPLNSTDGPTSIQALSPNAICEDFESGFNLGQRIGTDTDWFDGNNGPVVTSTIGVANSIGLTPGANSFTWIGQPFDWNNADFEGVSFQADFETDSSGHFDDDRLGWMISNSSNNPSDIFGVQMDPDGSGYQIEGYWEDAFGANRRWPIANLPVLKANTWYRFYAAIGKLTATSASIDVSLTELNASGDPVLVVATGSIANTSTLSDPTAAPATKYFTATLIYPTYKNDDVIAGAADNTCYEQILCYALTLSHTGQGSDPVASPANSTGCPAGKYRPGESISLSGAVASTGWHIVSWTGTDNDGSTASTNSLTMPNSSRTVAVNYLQDGVTEFTLTINVDGQGTVDKDPDQATYNFGDVVTMTATANAGWIFSDWSGDVVSTANPVQITMDGNKLVTATFKEAKFSEFLPVVIKP